MSTKFEAAAEALFLASGRAQDVAWKDANRVLALWPPGDVQDYFRKQVVAVLEAIREPDEAMVNAGYDSQCSEWPADWYEHPIGITPEVYIAKNVWAAMVDALLSEARVK